MHLTQKEEKMLSGEFGEAMCIAYRILLAIGRISNADRLVPIDWAHVSGVTYLTIGDYGVEFLQKISRDKGTKFKVFTTVNPCGMDTENWNSLKIPLDYAEKQFKIIAAYRRLGIARSFTCVPYQSYALPRKGSHVAWAESSAAIYANSMLGLRTNRESAVSALASALTGKTVYSGLHLDVNREPITNVKVALEGNRRLSGSVDFGILGYFAGKHVSGDVIGFQGIRKMIAIGEAKALCAAIGTTGSAGMFLLDSRARVKTIEFGASEYNAAFDEISDGEDGEAIIFGCPQMTIEELYDLSKLLYGKKLKKKCIVFTSSKVYDLALAHGYTNIIEGAGATFVRDSCADFTPLISKLAVDSVETDSCKGAYYMKKVHGVKVIIKDTKAILAGATT